MKQQPSRRVLCTPYTILGYVRNISVAYFDYCKDFFLLTSRLIQHLLCDFVPAIFFEGEHGHERPAILHRYTREFLFSFQRHTPCPDLKLNLCDIAEVIGKERKRARSVDGEEE